MNLFKKFLRKDIQYVRDFSEMQNTQTTRTIEFLNELYSENQHTDTQFKVFEA